MPAVDRITDWIEVLESAQPNDALTLYLLIGVRFPVGSMFDFVGYNNNEHKNQKNFNRKTNSTV